MPEGDSVFKAARRLRAQLVGRVVTRSEFRFGARGRLRGAPDHARG